MRGLRARMKKRPRGMTIDDRQVEIQHPSVPPDGAGLDPCSTLTAVSGEAKEERSRRLAEALLQRMYRRDGRREWKNAPPIPSFTDGRSASILPHMEETESRWSTC